MLGRGLFAVGSISVAQCPVRVDLQLEKNRTASRPEPNSQDTTEVPRFGGTGVRR